MSFTTTERRGALHREDLELYIQWAICGDRVGTPWCEFTISTQAPTPTGGSCLVPVAEGWVTEANAEYQTLGAYDGNPMGLAEAVFNAYIIAKEQL